jgi:TRAP-type mannitol/chloroaromatic compound transport system permease small subunit
LLSTLILLAYFYCGLFLFKSLAKHTNKFIKFIYIVAYLIPGLAILAVLLTSGLNANIDTGGGLILGVFLIIATILGIVVFCINGMAHLISIRLKRSGALTNKESRTEDS